MTSKRLPCALALLLLTLVVSASAQNVALSIAAGSPEDQATLAIANESDAQKRVTMWNDFLQKFAANPMAVAYGNLQLAELYQAAGDPVKALAAGEKAYAAVPNNIDILMTTASAAQQAKQYGKAVQYACKGGQLIQAESPQAREALQQQHDFLEVAALNAIAAEQNAKLRMTYIEQFTPAFPKSKFAEQIAQYGILSLQQLNDSARLADFGDKALAANPDSVPTLIVLANAFAEEQSGAHLAKAGEYAQRAIQLTKADQPGADKTRILEAGVAHSALGYVMLKQEKTLPAIAELKQASSMLKDDPAAYSTVLFRLGYAYAKLKRYPEAKAVLTEAVGVQGPFQDAARDLLGKVNSARTK
jgi:tetratricopeptide (TPR) repeat protein